MWDGGNHYCSELERQGGATTIAAALAAACAALWMILGVAAQRYPRKYYQLQAWRRPAIWIAAAALVFAFASILWRQVVYGAAH